MKVKIIQNVIDKLRKKKKNPFKGFMRENYLYLPEGADISKLHIRIDGRNNIIRIGPGLNISEALVICGFLDDGLIEIGDNFCCGNLEIKIGQDHTNYAKVKKSSIKIGNNVSFSSGCIKTYNSGVLISIGDNCMISQDVLLYNTDSHPIYNLEKNKILNRVSDMKIGNHVWLGLKCCILKNVSLADNIIVGYGSVVTKSFYKENVVIAGNPATVVKEDVIWDCCGGRGYVQNGVNS